MKTILIMSLFAGSVLFAKSEKAVQNAVRIELVSEVNSAMAGNEFLIGIRLKIEKGWHIYWKNSGDSGYPTEIHLTLPEGVTAGETIYPVPEKISWDGNANYGYSGEVMLMKKIRLEKGVYFPKGLEIKGKATYLVCKEKCIPGEGSFAMKLEYDSKSINKKGKAEIEKQMLTVPKKLELHGKFTTDKEKLFLTLKSESPEELLSGKTIIYPVMNAIIDNGQQFSHMRGTADNEVVFSVPLDKYKNEDPEEMSFVLINAEGFPSLGGEKYIEITVQRSNQ